MYTHKTKNIRGNWYAPLAFLKGLKRTVDAELWEMSSSAGDWSGWFVTKANKKYWLIGFDQENNSPKEGFTLRTGDTIASWNHVITHEEIQSIYQEYIELY